jgi:hypothetical protein
MMVVICNVICHFVDLEIMAYASRLLFHTYVLVYAIERESFANCVMGI